MTLDWDVVYLAKDSALDMSALRKQLWLRWQSETWSSIEIWAEAGRALVASAGYFVARVTERKHLHGKTFVFLAKKKRLYFVHTRQRRIIE
ncbi:MAG: hypothetical protein ABFS56_25720 [Pseudomonadota bacterium]